MGKKQLRVSGSKLKMLARMSESSGVGRMIKKQISKQMGLGAIAEARIEDDEVPASRPFAVWDALRASKSGGEGEGGQ